MGRLGDEERAGKRFSVFSNQFLVFGEERPKTQAQNPCLGQPEP
jgi:hypothetical protein